MNFKSVFSYLILFFSLNQALWADQAQEALNAHNKFRKLHHAPDLIWDSTLAEYAKNYASLCEFKHSRTPYGENLAAGYPSIEAAIQAWYDENEDYSYRWPGFSHQTGHFTQMVWKSTTKLGCAYVACNGKHGTPGHYLVCEYSPRGNIITGRRFRENVLPQG